MEPEEIAPEEELIEVLVDDVLVPVSKVEWDADSDAVTEQVRANRREHQQRLENIDPAPDYDALVEQYGQDGEPS